MDHDSGAVLADRHDGRVTQQAAKVQHITGLVADGVTTVSAIHHIERGYEGFVSKLVSLGAKAERDTVPDDEDAIRD